MDCEYYNNIVQKTLAKNSIDINPTYIEIQSINKHKIITKLEEILKIQTNLIWSKKIIEIREEANNHKIDKLAEFKLIPKIHKPTLSFRPLVSELQSITKPLSKFINTILLKLSKEFPWILTGTDDAIKKIETEEQFHFKEPIIVSMDIESMYTNIDVEQALRFIKIHMHKSTNPIFEKEEDKLFIIESLKWIFGNTYFKFGDRKYQQIKGIVMGTSCAPNFANLTMAFIEKQTIFRSLEKEKIPIQGYKRLIDDSQMIIPKEYKQKLKNIFDNCNKTLKFTMESTNNNEDTLAFLDLNLSIGSRYYKDSRLEYKNYSKPYAKFVYTDISTHQPEQYTFSWLTGETIRLIKTSSNQKNFESSFINYIERLL